MSKDYEFILSIELLESIRQFTHKNHQFPESYLKNLLSTLNHSKFNLTDETSNFKDITNLKILLIIHFVLANAINLSQLINLYHKDITLSELNLEQINNTNIFNHDTLYNALKRTMKDLKLSSSKLDGVSSTEDSSKNLKTRGLTLDKMTIQITHDDKQVKKSSKEMIVIPIQLVILSL